MISAIVYVVTARIVPDLDICLRHCEALGYQLIGIVKDDWAEALRTLHAGPASVLVVADRRSMPADRVPRVEIVAEAGSARNETRASRTRALRRNAAK